MFFIVIFGCFGVIHYIYVYLFKQMGISTIIFLLKILFIRHGHDALTVLYTRTHVDHVLQCDYTYNQ